MIDTLPNNKAGFQWKVFSVGRTTKIQVDCNMMIKRVSAEVTTAATGTTTAVITTEEQTTTEQNTALITQEMIDKY